MNSIVRIALRHRVLVLALALVAMGVGLWTTVHLPVDVFPDLNRPTVTVLTEAGGLSPEEVEVQVTRPIEAAMNGAPGVERVRSSSAVGLSIVWVELAWDTEPLVNRQLVAERLATLDAELPVGITPTMGPLTSIMGEIMLVGLVASDMPPSRLRTLADFTVRRQLAAVPGVAQVVTLGGGREVVRVAVDDDRLQRFGLTWDAVAATVEAAQANTTGGFLDRQNEEWMVRNIARPADLETALRRLRETVVAVHDGVPVRLDAVADVDLGPDVMRGDAGVNGHPAVILSIQKQPGAHTIALTAAVHVALDRIARSLPSNIELVPLFEQADFIEASNLNVEHALRDGALLVAVVLFFFLQNLRTTFITLTAIPLSLALTALVFDALDMSVNTMTLGGIAVAIGELVDDAIVDVENVFRRLRENNASASPRHHLTVIWEASVEVRGSIVFATLLVILVFVPLFALSGIEGRLFAPLGIAYIVSILSSLIVSITVTPALCAFLLPRAKAMGSRSTERPSASARARDSFLVRHLKAAQGAVLGSILRGTRPFVVLAVALALVLTAIASLPLFGREFLPAFNEGTATINVMATPGTSLTTSNALGRAAEKLISSVPEVKSVGRRTGRAEADEHAEGVHYTEIDVDFHPEAGRPRPDVLADIRERLGLLPGIVVNIGQPISHRLDHLLSGVRSQVAIKVFGPDLADLRTTAAKVEAIARAVPGLVDVQREQQALIPQVRIDVRWDDAARYGFAPGALSERLEALLAGRHVGRVMDGERAFPIRLRLAQADDFSRLPRVQLDTPTGLRVPLEALADVRLAHGPNQILHDNGMRRIVVAANVHDRDLGSAVEELQAKLAALPLAEDQHLTFEGQFQSQTAATTLIGWLAILSLCGMTLILWLHFRSLALVTQVLVNIPLALIGSVAALALADLPLSVATLVGFITLCGIASRNSILLIDHYLHLMRVEAQPFSLAMIIRGSAERLVPVLMTALTAGLGLVPLVLSADAPGKEILHPVAVVILGGLISSTLLDLVVTPAAFWLYGQRAAERSRAAHDVHWDNIDERHPPLMEKGHA